MARDDATVKINLRIPQHLLDRIDLVAAGRRRSRNSEILACIEYAIEAPRERERPAPPS